MNLAAWFDTTVTFFLDVIKLTQSGQVVWWSQVAASGPYWCHWTVSQLAVSGLSEKGWCLAQHASECPAHGCTPVPGPPPHSGAPGSLSDTHMYAVGCRSHGSGRGAGSQLKREHRERPSFQQVTLKHAPSNPFVQKKTVVEMVVPDFNNGVHSELNQSRGH